MRAYVFACRYPDGTSRAVADETGRLVATQLDGVADLFASCLRRRGLDVTVESRTAEELRDVIRGSGVPPDEVGSRFFFIEATATGPVDLGRWTIELADRVPVARSEDV